MARGDTKFYQFLLNGFPIILLFFFALTGYSFSFNIFKIVRPADIASGFPDNVPAW